MNVKRIGVRLVTLTMVVALAACGGEDTSSRNRNAALEGKQQCLSDEDSSITSGGVATLTFCEGATSFVVVAADGTESEAQPVGSDGTATYTAASSLDVVRVKSFDASEELVGEDLVTLTLPSCAGGAACKVGDTGPGGGVVLYDAGSSQAWGRYIEMALPGWFDGTSFSENPSDDPAGSFGCESTDIGTSLALGTGADNTAKWNKDCDTTPGYMQRAYKLVSDFNASKITPVDTWVIPSWRDLFTMHTAPLPLLEKIVPRGAITTSSEDPNSRSSQMCIYRYVKFWESPAVSAQDNYYNLVTYSCSGVTRKSEMNNFPVRPVHYFDASGEAKATITIVGQMDIPVPPTTENVTTTTEAPDVVTAPTGEYVTFGPDNTTVVGWAEDENADKNSETQVQYSTEGAEPVTVSATTASTAIINNSAFAEGKEYTFQVQRTGKKSGEVVKGTEMPFTPVPKAVEATTTTVEETPTTVEETPTTVEATTTTVEETPTTVEETSTTVEETATTVEEGNTLTRDKTLDEKWADCGTAPVVSFDQASVESSGQFSYSVQWPCLAYPEFSPSVMHRFGNGLTGGTYFSDEDLASRTKEDTFTFTAPVGAGPRVASIHVSYDGFAYDKTDNVTFKPYPVSFDVPAESVGNFKECTKNDIVIADNMLTMNCDVTGGMSLRLDNPWSVLKSSNSSIDLSKIPDGWNPGRLAVESGANLITVEGLYCARSCKPSSNLDVVRTAGQDNNWNFKVSLPEWCTDPIFTWTGGWQYMPVVTGVLEEETVNSVFLDALEINMLVDPAISLVRVGSPEYICRNPAGEERTESLYSEFDMSDAATTPTDESTTTTEAPTVESTSTTEAPAEGTTDTTVTVNTDAATTIPSGVDAPDTSAPQTTEPPIILNLPETFFAPREDDKQPEIPVPSNASGFGVSAAGLETILANAGTTVPVVVASFDTGEKVGLRRGHDTVVPVPKSASTVTFTAFKKDGTKVETTSKLVVAKPLVAVEMKSANEGSGFPLIPVIIVLLVLAVIAFFVLNRRKSAA